MKLAPVRVFSCKHPLIEVSVKKELTVIIFAQQEHMYCSFSSSGLTDPVLIRLDVDSKLSEQLKV